MKNNKGFSLVELLVGMIIIAVLISIAAFGIQILQRNSRDTVRRKVVQDLVLLYTEVANNSSTAIGSIEVQGTAPLTFNMYGGGNPLGVTGVEVTGGGVNNSEANAYNDTNGSCTTLDGTAEDDNNTINLCFDTTSGLLGVRLEGSTEVFTIPIE